VSSGSAAELADSLVAAARDDPAERLQLAAGNFECGLPAEDSWRRFARAELDFLRAQIARGVLAPTDAPRAGSPWWRAVNERLLRDATEATLLVRSQPGRPSAPSVELWLAFVDEPSAASWYRAHNASIVAAYLEHESLAERELLAERFFMNVALIRVLYAHALAEEPRLALGRFAPLGRLFGDPRRGTVGRFLAVRNVFPNRYPLTGASLEDLVAAEHRLFRPVDYGVIGARIDALYAFAARSLGEPRAEGLLQEGIPAYAWPTDVREPWVGGGRRLGPRLFAWATGGRGQPSAAASASSMESSPEATYRVRRTERGS
jgi:hypothetical protein